MPRIPQYDSRIGVPVAQGSSAVPAPRRLAVPSISVPKSLNYSDLVPAAMADFGLAIAQSGKVLSEIADRMNHAKQIDDLAQATVESRLKMADLAEKIKANQDPNQWGPKFIEEGQKIFKESLEKLSDPAVKAQFKQHWAYALPTQYQKITTEARKKQIDQISGNAAVYYNKSVELYVNAKSDVERVQIKDELFSLIGALERTGVVEPVKAEKMRQEFDHEVRLNVFSKDVNANPSIAKDKLDKNIYGFPEDEKRRLMPSVMAAVHRQQDEYYEAIIQGINKGQYPSESQLQGLRPSQVHVLTNLIKSKYDETNPDTKVALAKQVIDLKEGDAENGKALLDKILTTGGLSANDKISLYNNAHKKITKAEKMVDVYEEKMLQHVHQMVGTEYDNFLHKWYTDPNGRAKLKPEMTREEVNKAVLDFAAPYYHQHAINEANKAVGKNKKDLKAILGYSGGAGQFPKTRPAPGGEATLLTNKDGTPVLDEGKPVYVFPDGSKKRWGGK